MPTPTDDRRGGRAQGRAGGAAHLDAHLATTHLTDFAAVAGGLLDENGLTITRLRRIA